ncbi:MAG: TPM domain-containing protein [Sphingomonadaceae bacterium]|uniref:TPM domain-containing protein n=1 Tax=Thermaurantiacus sp. TaxID=2820283 RepID=UPI00298F00A0|nr:TPM domain-containing protein [Thermaurantiacus sp.]MCS6987184.1 TPM domain-containing protein [Sphingomonadaceae bacterium]MDW8415782.1 TPM domain-containing protein [Thermaurantiacus sp.]
MLRLLAWLLWVAIGVGAAAGQTFPPLTGRVVDAADLLPPQAEARLADRLARLEAETGGTQVVVVTVPSLEGYDIADYGVRLGRAWGIGRKGRDDGALLIVAPNERRVRIEVGYGLEERVPDALAFLIIDERIRPRFQAGDFVGGIEAGVEALAALLRLPPEEAQRLAAEAERKAEAPGAGAFLFFVLVVMVVAFLLRSGGGAGIGPTPRRRGPIVLWGPGLGGWGGGGFGGGGFSGGGGSFGGGGASGSW